MSNAKWSITISKVNRLHKHTHMHTHVEFCTHTYTCIQMYTVLRTHCRALKSHALGVRHTHFQPMHTLTRQTSYFSRREITRMAPTKLRRYLTVGQVSNGFPVRRVTRRPLLPGIALFLRHFKNFKIVRVFIKASYMFTFNSRCISLGRSQTSCPPLFCSVLYALVEVTLELPSCFKFI